MFVVDTNVLAYAADRRSPFFSRCSHLLGVWQRQASPWFITWGIVYEFLRVATHPRIFPSPLTLPQAWSILDSLRASPGFGFLTHTDRHAKILEEVFKEIPRLEGNIVHDLHTAVLMKENGIRRIYTSDVHFHRFSFLEVVDPLTLKP